MDLVDLGSHKDRVYKMQKVKLSGAIARFYDWH
jgi:hypothetical protein